MTPHGMLSSRAKEVSSPRPNEFLSFPSWSEVMRTEDDQAARIWRQKMIPVAYRRGGSNPLMVKLPYSPENYAWLKGEHRNKPEWNQKFTCWEAPKAWFDDIVTRALERYGQIYVIQPYRAQEKCAPACWNATGFECQCSCMGENHGSHGPLGKWFVVSDTCAVRWHDRELACRLIEKSVK
jgi:hypothetical protein